MKSIAQWILIFWFFVLAGFVLWPSYWVLDQARNYHPATVLPPRAPDPPPPLEIPRLDPNTPPATLEKLASVYAQQVANFTQQVASYTQSVNAYNQEVAAYKAYADQTSKGGLVEAYTNVVKGNLTSLLTMFLATFVAFAFGRVVNNYIRFKASRDLDPYP